MILEQYEHIFNCTQNALFILEVRHNSQFVYLMTNQYHQDQTGISLNDIQHRTPEELLGPELGRVVSLRYLECIQGKKPISYQETLPLNSGTKTWETTLTPIFKKGSKPWIVGSSQDITELILSRNQYMSQKKAIEHVIDSIPLSIFLADHDGIITYGNTPFLNLCDQNNVLPMGKSFYSLFQIQQNLFNQDSQQKIQTEMIRSNSTKAGNYDLSLIDYTFPDSILKGMVGLVEDKTQDSLNTQQLRAVENRFRSMVQNIPGVVFRLTDDEDWTFVYVSEGITDLLGYSPKDFYTKTQSGLLSFILPEWRDFIVTELRYALRNNLTINLDFQAMTRTQQILWLQIRGKRVLGLPGTLITFDGAIFDITDAKQYQQNLEHAREQAEIASKTKSEFLANMSHELRTPLNAVVGFSDLLLTTELSQVQRQFAKNVSSSSRLLLQIISDILDFSKIEAGKLLLSPQPTNIGQVIQEIKELFQEQVANKGLDVNIILSERLPTKVFVDALRLEQVLINFVSNGIKFTQKGSIEIEVACGVENSSTRRITFYVRDTGIGISEAEASKLFQPFTQGDGSITRKYGGTGLGLVISKSIIQAMGGDISLTSTQGVGSEFSFSLLLEEIPELNHEQGKKLSTHTPGEYNKEIVPHVSHDIDQTRSCCTKQNTPHINESLILIVDDVPINLLLAKSLVQKSLPQARIYEATNAHDAIQLAEEFDFDLILMDIQMPEKDGISATKEILEIKQVPIVALTAGVMPEERENCLNAVMVGFLSKPVSLQEIRLMLANQGFPVV